MSDYIKREDAIKGLEMLIEPVERDEHDVIWNDGVKSCINDIKHHTPPADVVEVRHGRWKCEEVQCVFGRKFILTCTECGESVSVTEEALPEEHYCRSCGAKMDGEEE